MRALQELLQSGGDVQDTLPNLLHSEQLSFGAEELLSYSDELGELGALLDPELIAQQVVDPELHQRRSELIDRAGRPFRIGTESDVFVFTLQGLVRGDRVEALRFGIHPAEEHRSYYLLDLNEREACQIHELQPPSRRALTREDVEVFDKFSQLLLSWAEQLLE